MSRAADRIFLGGVVLPLTEPRARAEALAVSEGRILAVGSREEVLRLRASHTQIVDLKGRALLPGFVDAHTHLVSQGLKEIGYYLDLSLIHI